MLRRSNESFNKNNAIFWVASLGVSFINYLYYPVLGRLMKADSFGDTQTIISFFTQISSFFLVLSLISIGIIAKYSDEKQRKEVTNELSRLALLVSVFFLMLSFIFSGVLKHFFHFDSSGPFFLLGITIVFSVPLSFANAFLQGNKRFKALASVNLLGSINKLVLSVIFVLFGFKTMGAIGGLLLAQIIGLIYSLKIGSGIKDFISAHFKATLPSYKLLKSELPYAGMVLATSLTTNLLLSFDILVVKHYFPPTEAGLYTGISITSNIIFFVTSPFAAVMIPSIKQSQTYSKNIKILKRSLMITTSVGGSALVFFMIFPHLTVLILLGKKYAVYSSFLRGLAFSMFALSLANLLIYYHIGLRHFLVAPTVLVGLVSTLVLIGIRHGSMSMIVWDLVEGSLILLVLVASLLLFYRRGINWQQDQKLA